MFSFEGLALESADKKCKIAHVTSAHFALDPRIYQKECISLMEAGFDVTVIGSHSTGGVINNIKIVSVSIPKNRILRILSGPYRVGKECFKGGYQILHFHDPELLPLGIVMKMFRKRVIFDMHEHIPLQIKSKNWIAKPFRGIASTLFGWLEYIICNLFDGLVAATPLIAERYDTSKCVVVQNFPQISEIGKTSIRPYGERPNRVLYLGNVSEMRGMKEMMSAFQILDDYDDIEFVFCGKFEPVSAEESFKKMQSNLSHKVQFIGWQDRNGVVQQLKQAKVGLILLHPEPNYLDSYPTKLFEYMGAGIPVIASDFPLWRKIITEARCGYVVNPFDPKEISASIKRLLDNPSEAIELGGNGIKAIETIYNWEAEREKLLGMYRLILNDKRIGDN